MRVAPIIQTHLSVNHLPKCVSRVQNTRNVTAKNISFNGVNWGGTLGSVIGTFAGIGIGALATVATGGLAAPIILGMAGAAVGGIGGDVINSKINSSSKPDPGNGGSGGSDIDSEFEKARLNNY